MVGAAKAVGSFAVDDLAVAPTFDGQTLGLGAVREDGPLLLHLAGDQPILVSPKPDHTPASFTILSFPVDAIDQAVDELAARGCRSSAIRASTPIPASTAARAFDRLVRRPRRQRPVDHPAT